MKIEKTNTPSENDAEKSMQILDFDLEEGASILFAPTGEQWRITTIEEGQIIFERLP